MNIMKKKFLFPFLGLVFGVFTTVCVQSCIDSDANDDDDPVVCPSAGVPYMGQLQVERPFFEDDSVRVTFFRLNDVLGQIVMYNVTFSARMQRLSDMTIDSISVAATGDILALTGENIVPTSGGNPFSKYIITNLRGTVTQDSLKVSMTCGGMPLSFRGEKQNDFIP